MTFNPNIGILKLSGNNLGDEGTKIIAKAIHSNGSIHHAKLHTLDFGFNNMSDDGCIALVVHAISRNFNLLNDTDNVINSKPSYCICSGVIVTNPSEEQRFKRTDEATGFASYKPMDVDDDESSSENDTRCTIVSSSTVR